MVTALQERNRRRANQEIENRNRVIQEEFARDQARQTQEVQQTQTQVQTQERRYVVGKTEYTKDEIDLAQKLIAKNKEFATQGDPRLTRLIQKLKGTPIEVSQENRSINTGAGGNQLQGGITNEDIQRDVQELKRQGKIRYSPAVYSESPKSYSENPISLNPQNREGGMTTKDNQVAYVSYQFEKEKPDNSLRGYQNREGVTSGTLSYYSEKLGNRIVKDKDFSQTSAIPFRKNQQGTFYEASPEELKRISKEQTDIERKAVASTARASIYFVPVVGEIVGGVEGGERAIRGAIEKKPLKVVGGVIESGVSVLGLGIRGGSRLVNKEIKEFDDSTLIITGDRIENEEKAFDVLRGTKKTSKNEYVVEILQPSEAIRETKFKNLNRRINQQGTYAEFDDTSLGDTIGTAFEGGEAIAYKRPIGTKKIDEFTTFDVGGRGTPQGNVRTVIENGQMQVVQELPVESSTGRFYTQQTGKGTIKNKGNDLIIDYKQDLGEKNYQTSFGLSQENENKIKVISGTVEKARVNTLTGERTVIGKEKARGVIKRYEPIEDKGFTVFTPTGTKTPLKVTFQPEEETIELFQGTTKESADLIRKEGFKTSAQIGQGQSIGTRPFISTTDDRAFAEGYGNRAAVNQGTSADIVTAKLSKSEYERILKRQGGKLPQGEVRLLEGDKYEIVGLEKSTKSNNINPISGLVIKEKIETLKPERPSYVGGTGGVRSQGKYFAQGYDPQEQIIVLESKLKSPVMEKSLSKLSFDVSNNQKERVKFNQGEKIKVLEITKQEQIPILKEILRLKEKQLLRQRNQIKQRFKDNTNINTRIKTIPVKSPINESGAESIPKKNIQIKESDFEVFVKSKGKDIKIGEFKDLKEARESLVSNLKSTLRASGFITENNQKVRVDKLNVVGKEFGASKKDSTRLIQQRGFRLGTRTEVKDIQIAKRSKKFKL